METFVKIGFAKISLAAPKSGLPKIWEGGGRIGSPQLPPARTLMGALTPLTIEKTNTTSGASESTETLS